MACPATFEQRFPTADHRARSIVRVRGQRQPQPRAGTAMFAIPGGFQANRTAAVAPYPAARYRAVLPVREKGRGNERNPAADAVESQGCGGTGLAGTAPTRSRVRSECPGDPISWRDAE